MSTTPHNRVSDDDDIFSFPAINNQDGIKLARERAAQRYQGWGKKRASPVESAKPTVEQTPQQSERCDSPRSTTPDIKREVTDTKETSTSRPKTTSVPPKTKGPAATAGRSTTTNSVPIVAKSTMTNSETTTPAVTTEAPKRVTNSRPPTASLAKLITETHKRKHSSSNEHSPTSASSNPTSTSRTFSSLPNIPKRPKIVPQSASSDKPQNPSPPNAIGSASSSKREPPQWYTAFTPKELSRPPQGNRQLAERIRAIRELIRECQAERHPDTLQSKFGRVRKELHYLEFQAASSWQLRKARILHNEDGLPQIFDKEFNKGCEFPWDIKADAEMLYNKWCSQLAYLKVVDVDLLRGIETKKSTGRIETKKSVGRNSDSIAKGYAGKVRADVFGHNGLINGQWWPTQLCAVRDGAHGSSQGGIAGKSGVGAYSIVISGGSQYQDRDEGEEVWYCGTDGTGNGESTENTKRMVESAKGLEPVRVLRSHGLHKGNKYRPQKGFRYDGLYDVVGFQILDAAKQVHRFHMKRREGQDPIRFEGEEARPTLEEIGAYEAIRHMINHSEC